MSNSLILDAALRNLSSGIYNEEDAQDIIDFACDIPKEKMFQYFIQKKSDGSSISGATEMGHISVADDSEKIKRWSNEQYKRIGHYKISRPGKDLIEFYYFWASDETTISEGNYVTKFLIRFEPDTNKCIWFGSTYRITKFKWWIFKIDLEKIKIIYGSDKFNNKTYSRILCIGNKL